jgi:hypothetical protein
LCRFFEDKDQQKDSGKESGHRVEAPELLLQRLQLNHLVARPIGEAPVQSRFLKYNPVMVVGDDSIQKKTERFDGPSALLPDGLHVYWCVLDHLQLFRYGFSTHQTVGEKEESPFCQKTPGLLG